MATGKTGMTGNLSGRDLFLAGLAVVTVLFTLLAVFAAGGERRATEQKFSPRPMFPTLATLSDDAIQSIEVASKDATLVVARNEVENIWVLPEKGNFPARPDLVRATVTGLRDLRLLEPKTAREEWHKFVGLVAPESGGTGTRITLKGADGAPLASVIYGERLDLGRVDGQSIHYARRPDEAQTWLASSILDPQTQISEWLQTNFLDISRHRISEMRVTPAEGESYAIVRPAQDKDDLVLEGMPEGRQLRQGSTLETAASALVATSFTDVQEAASFDFADAARTVVRTYDGLVLTLETIKVDGQSWTTVEASVDEALLKPETAAGSDKSFIENKLKTGEAVKREAEVINRRARGWAFAVSGYTAARIAGPVEGLLSPLPEAGPAGAGAGATAPAAEGGAPTDLGADRAVSPDQPR